MYQGAWSAKSLDGFHVMLVFLFVASPFAAVGALGGRSGIGFIIGGMLALFLLFRFAL